MGIGSNDFDFGNDLGSTGNLDDDDDLFASDNMDEDGFGDMGGFMDSSAGRGGLNNSSGGFSEDSDNNWDEDDNWGDDEFSSGLDGNSDLKGTGSNIIDESQAVEEKNNQITQVAIYGIIIAVVVIIAVCLVARLRNKALENTGSNKAGYEEQYTNTKPAKQDNANSSSGQTSSGQASGGQVASSWSKITYDSSWKFSDPVEGTMTVTAVDTYAKILSNGEVQIRTEVTGSIAGLLGTYSMEIPSEVTSVVTVASMLNVTYQIAESGNNRIVTNIQVR